MIPSTVIEQGNDSGVSSSLPQFIIPLMNKKQRHCETIADVDASELWAGKVVMKVEPVSDFLASRN